MQESHRLDLRKHAAGPPGAHSAPRRRTAVAAELFSESPASEGDATVSRPRPSIEPHEWLWITLGTTWGNFGVPLCTSGTGLWTALWIAPMGPR